MATLSVVVVALITAYKGAMTVDADQINLMRTLGASKRHIFRKLIVPASLGDIFAGLKLTVGFALIGAIIGEFMSSSRRARSRDLQGRQPVHHSEGIRGAGGHHHVGAVPHLYRRQDRAAAHALAATLTDGIPGDTTRRISHARDR